MRHFFKRDQRPIPAGDLRSAEFGTSQVVSEILLPGNKKYQENQWREAGNCVDACPGAMPRPSLQVNEDLVTKQVEKKVEIDQTGDRIVVVDDPDGDCCNGQEQKR